MTLSQSAKWKKSLKTYITLKQKDITNLCHYVHATKNTFVFINFIHFYKIISNGCY